MSLTLRSLAIMFITYFIQPWKYYNIGRRCCQEVNRILVTDCYFLGIGKKMLIFLAFWEGLFGLWTNYEFFVNFFWKKDWACGYLSLPKKIPEQKNGQNWPSRRQDWFQNDIKVILLMFFLFKIPIKRQSHL